MEPVAVLRAQEGDDQQGGGSKSVDKEGVRRLRYPNSTGLQVLEESGVLHQEQGEVLQQFRWEGAGPAFSVRCKVYYRSL